MNPPVTDSPAASAIPLSLLDRALTRTGVPDATILTEVVERARAAEDLGFHGFWVAEHHAVPGIAGSAPTVLAAAIAGATSRMRVGTGGIMVPAHPPFIIAEAIAVLTALHPDRLDWGLGASLGFTSAVRRVLLQSDDAADRFGDDVTRILEALGGASPVTLRPEPTTPARLHVLTGGARLPLAAGSGLGAVMGGPSIHPPEDAAAPRRGRPGHSGLADYRRTLRPSAHCPVPRVTVSVPVFVADTPEAARRLALPEAWATALSRSTGSFDPLQPAEELDVTRLTRQQAARVERALAQTVHGTPEQVQERLTAIVRWTGADELLLTGGVSDPAGGAHSDRLLASLRVEA